MAARAGGAAAGGGFAACGRPGGVNVFTPGADAGALEGWSTDGMNRVVAPAAGFWNERMTGEPGGAGGGGGGASRVGAAAAGGGTAAGVAGAGGSGTAPSGFPQPMQVFAPGSLYASHPRQTMPRIPVSRPSSTGAPQAGQLPMVRSRFAAQLLHFKTASTGATRP